MKKRFKKWFPWAALAVCLGLAGAVYAQKSSYAPVMVKEPFAKVIKRMTMAKAEVMKRQMADLAHEQRTFC